MKKAATLKILSSTTLLALLVLLLPFYEAHAGIGEFFYNQIVIQFFGWLVFLAGIVLNYSINAFIVGFGVQFATGGIGVVVDETWAIIRDLFNLTFIFGLVYIGFKMILRSDDGQTRRWLINLILAALLVNFSLFITKFVIDFSNVLAVEVINLGMETEVPTGGGGTSAIFTPQTTRIGGQDIAGVDISRSMQDIMRIVTVGSNKVEAAAYTKDADFSMIFGTMIIFIVTTFVYLSAAIMIIIRGVTLIVLMILSPFLFLGMVIPALQRTSSSMWQMLFKRAFFAPIYIVFLFIALNLAGNFMGVLGPDANFAQALGGNADGAAAVTSVGSTFGPFIVIIALLVLSLVAAQKLGAEGASSAIKAGNSMRRFGQRQVGSATIGMGARLGRNTVGAGANRIARSNTLRSLAASSGVTGFAARQAMRGTKKVADSSFDARGLMSKDMQKQVGKPKKGGYVTRQKEDQKLKEKMVEDIGTRDLNDPKVQAQVEQLKEQIKAQQKEFEETKDLPTDALDVQAEVREAAIKIGEQKLKEGQKNGTLSEREESDLKNEIALNKAVLEQTQALRDEKSAIDSLSKTIDELSEAEKKASSPGEAADIRTQIERAQAEKEQRKNRITNLGTNLARRADPEKIDDIARNEIKYKDRTDYMQALEDGKKFKNTVASVLSGKALYNYAFKKKNPEQGYASGSSQAAATATGVWAFGGAAGAAGGLAGGVTGGGLAHSAAYMDSQTIAGLKKKYGKDAVDMATKDKENDDKEKMKKIMKELDDETKTSDGGTSGSEDKS